LTNGAIGTVWPDLRDDFGRTDGSFGQVFACLAGSYLVASVASGHLSERFGMKTVFRMRSTLAALAFGVIGLGSSWATTLVGFALPLLGFAFSVMFPAVVNRTRSISGWIGRLASSGVSWRRPPQAPSSACLPTELVRRCSAGFRSSSC
jgi:MFS family permease